MTFIATMNTTAMIPTVMRDNKLGFTSAQSNLTSFLGDDDAALD
jgi:hypothetical protein